MRVQNWEMVLENLVSQRWKLSTSKLCAHDHAISRIRDATRVSDLLQPSQIHESEAIANNFFPSSRNTLGVKHLSCSISIERFARKLRPRQILLKYPAPAASSFNFAPLLPTPFGQYVEHQVNHQFWSISLDPGAVIRRLVALLISEPCPLNKMGSYSCTRSADVDSQGWRGAKQNSPPG